MARPTAAALLLMVAAAVALELKPVDVGQCSKEAYSTAEIGLSCEVKEAKMANDGRSALVSFTYITQEPASYATLSILLDDGSPLPDVDTAACRYTRCPVFPDMENNFTYPLDIQRDKDGRLLEGTFTLTWLLKGSGNPKPSFECCLLLKFTVP